MPATGNASERPSRGGSLRLLTFSTLYPNEVMPHNGIFVEQRLRKLLDFGDVTSRVVAPVPWFPSTGNAFGTYAEFAAVPRRETRYGITIEHPRYPLIPKVGMSSAPILLAAAAYRLLKRHARDATGFDVIDAHYFYPDGIAAALLGKWLSKPVTITARGTDVNLIPRYAVPRKWILWAAKRCARAIAVSDALRDRMVEIGVDPGKVVTLRNGVDLDLFRPPDDREALRSKLGFAGRTLLSVGHLIERKGHHLVIEAMADIPEASLVVVGTGPMKGDLESLVARHGLEGRVRLAGGLTHAELVEYYGAADALVLASSREGMANVLLESLACGTPVVATPIWGNPEVVAEARAGVLTRDRSAPAIARAVAALFDHPPQRSDIRRYAERFSWDATSGGQISIFSEAVHGASSAAAGVSRA